MCKACCWSVLAQEVVFLSWNQWEASFSMRGILKAPQAQQHFWVQPCQRLPGSWWQSCLPAAPAGGTPPSLSRVWAIIPLAITAVACSRPFCGEPGLWWQLRYPELQAGEVFCAGSLEWIWEHPAAPALALNSWCQHSSALSLLQSAASCVSYMSCVYQNHLIYDYRGFDGSELRICHNWRLATELSLHSGNWGTEIMKDCQSQAANISVIFSVCICLASKRGHTKDEGKNKLRGHFPIRPSCNGLAQLFLVVPFLRLWWAAGGSRAEPSCHLRWPEWKCAEK